jgi:signal transduction histidine kinase
MRKELEAFLSRNPAFQEIASREASCGSAVSAVAMDCTYWFLSKVMRETEEVMEIDPGLDQKKILEIAAELIVRDLGAAAASIRLFDPESFRMLTYGSHGMAEEQRMVSVPFEQSIAGKVVRENRSIVVASILKDPLYQDKEIVKKRGFHSLLAVPLRIPTFLAPGGDLLGSLQIYFLEDDRQFEPMEILCAEMLARRVSHVVAKKKIMDLKKFNEHKERIVSNIYEKLSKREGIKLKDLFMLLIPELREFLKIKSCSLFTLSDDQRFIHLEAAYPMDEIYHEPGYVFTVEHHPYFHMAVSDNQVFGDRLCERVDPSYVLIKDPLRSELTSPGVRAFVEQHHIYSILLVPLRVDEKVRHILAFYTAEQKQYFANEEIELLTFFGKEIIKASRLEFLDDVLHDFKNPAVAIAGFARRSRRLLESKDPSAALGKLSSYLDVMEREAARLQDMALARQVSGSEEMLDLGVLALERFRLNEAVIEESRRRNIVVTPMEIEPDLFVYCPRFELERVLDNLLHNATKAIPAEGGVLGMRGYRDGTMACLELSNSGEIPADQIAQVRKGRVKGRGLNIIYRFVQANHGSIDLSTEGGKTVFTIRLPLQHPEGLGST